MDSVFIAARAGVDENAAAPSATLAGPNSASLRVIVMDTSLSRETLPEAWRAFEGMSSGKVLAPIVCQCARRRPGSRLSTFTGRLRRDFDHLAFVIDPVCQMTIAERPVLRLGYSQSRKRNSRLTQLREVRD
jgi:hypothetical protein